MLNFVLKLSEKGYGRRSETLCTAAVQAYGRPWLRSTLGVLQLNCACTS